MYSIAVSLFSKNTDFFGHAVSAVLRRQALSRKVIADESIDRINKFPSSGHDAEISFVSEIFLSNVSEVLGERPGQPC